MNLAYVALAALYALSQKGHPSSADFPEQENNSAMPSPLRNQSTQTLLTISGPGGEPTLLPPTALRLHPSTTLLTATEEVLRTKKIPFATTTLDNTRYVTEIAGLEQFLEGPTSGWLCRVNGQLISECPALYRVQKGDFIEWIYTTNLGKDLNSPLSPGTSYNNYYIAH